MLTLEDEAIPEKLRAIPDAPKTVYCEGNNTAEILRLPTVAIVGSRMVSHYGRHVTEQLATELASRGVVIVSGLALGVDSIAHAAALKAGGITIAVLPGGIKRVYPRSHQGLATEIIKQGGALISEKKADETPMKMDFLIRNRLISGLSDGVIVTEAAIRSGSLNTARHALEQGRTVMAVPGNITSDLSSGTNNLLKMGATPITCAEDVYAALNWTPPKTSSRTTAYSEEENAIISLLKGNDFASGEYLLAESGLSQTQFSQTMTMLEINGIIKPLGANTWGLA